MFSLMSKSVSNYKQLAVSLTLVFVSSCSDLDVTSQPLGVTRVEYTHVVYQWL